MQVTFLSGAKCQIPINPDKWPFRPTKISSASFRIRLKIKFTESLQIQLGKKSSEKRCGRSDFIFRNQEQTIRRSF